MTADDVRRVVKDYFDPKTRTVAIYRTKEGAPTEGEDPELAAILEKLSPQQRDRTKAMIKRIRESTDLDRLRPMLQMMEQGASSDQVPEEQKMMFEYVLKVLSARVVELEAADKESD